MDFVSPQGGVVPLDERSMKPIYVDKSARKLLARSSEFMYRLNHTLAPSSIDPTRYEKQFIIRVDIGTMWDFRIIRNLKILVKLFTAKVVSFQRFVMAWRLHYLW